MEEEEFHRYMSEVHAPLVRDLLARHGIVRYSMVSSLENPAPCTSASWRVANRLLQTHNTSTTRSLMAQIRDAQFQNDADYDMVTQIRFPDIKNFVNFRNDPFYKKKVMSDHDHFTDPERVL